MEALKQLEGIVAQAKEALQQAHSMQDLQQVKSTYLGKKGPIQDAMLLMKSLPNDEKPMFGQAVNDVKKQISELLEEKEKQIELDILNRSLKEETIDITLPSIKMHQGYSHPLSSIIEEIEDLFVSMGYQVVEGPEVETDEFNFEMLNIPSDHPARDMQDTFYFDPKLLLRTHTSPVQARTMQASDQECIKIICPGKTYRRDDDDATHSHQFTQIEGLVVGKNITMADLKGTLNYVVKAMFGQKREIRLRPSYFPFTEPSAEVDVSCSNCQGKGCPTCKHTGWIEILGSGMVHPNVLRMGGYDPEIYSGFAFGVGIERVAMLRYGVDNIRHFYTNDLRFLEQFKSQ